MSTHSSDTATVWQIADEIAARSAAGPMDISFSPLTVLQLVGLLQLARRHPQFGASSIAVVDRFLAAARVYFAHCPTVLQIIQLGDDPAHDRPLGCEAKRKTP